MEAYSHSPYHPILALTPSCKSYRLYGLRAVLIVKIFCFPCGTTVAWDPQAEGSDGAEYRLHSMEHYSGDLHDDWRMFGGRG